MFFLSDEWLQMVEILIQLANILHEWMAKMGIKRQC